MAKGYGSVGVASTDWAGWDGLGGNLCLDDILNYAPATNYWEACKGTRILPRVHFVVDS